jgi:carboxypeptidase family protein
MNSRVFRYFLFAWICCLAVVSSVPMRAQVTGATLSGTITDPQGGAIPNAKISAKNVATGIATETTTNATGTYSLPNLNPSDYEVSVFAAGFSTSMVKVTLTVGAKQEMSLALTVGEVQQVVRVSGAAPIVVL